MLEVLEVGASVTDVARRRMPGFDARLCEGLGVLSERLATARRAEDHR